jgi:hypothetical protein
MPCLIVSCCATGRIGGRTYSVPPSRLGKPFTLDVGAYRFTPDMHLPGDLILHHLKLPTECYEPDCPSAKDDFPKPFMFNCTRVPTARPLRESPRQPRRSRPPLRPPCTAHRFAPSRRLRAQIRRRFAASSTRRPGCRAGTRRRCT